MNSKFVTSCHTFEDFILTLRRKSACRQYSMHKQGKLMYVMSFTRLDI